MPSAAPDICGDDSALLRARYLRCEHTPRCHLRLLLAAAPPPYMLFDTPLDAAADTPLHACRHFFSAADAAADSLRRQPATPYAADTITRFSLFFFRH